MCEAINENKRAELISILVENLPVFRAKLGATQDTFAQRVGLTKTTLNHIENYKKELIEHRKNRLLKQILEIEKELKQFKNI